MTGVEIKKFNEDLRKSGIDSEQGIYTEPYGISTKERRPVLYLRYETGGMTGGSYHEDSYLRPYEVSEIPEWVALDRLLYLLHPQLPEFQREMIMGLIEDSDYTDNEDYYGNSTDYATRWIPVEEIEKIVNQ